jgi:hypothetical protein
LPVIGPPNGLSLPVSKQRALRRFPPIGGNRTQGSFFLR